MNSDADQPSVAPLRTALRLVLSSGAWLAVAALFAVQLYALGLFPWRSALVLALLDWGPWVVFGPLVLWLARRVPLTPQTWRRALPLHCASCVLVVVLIGASTSLMFSRREILSETRRPEPPPERAAGPDGPPRHGRPDGFVGSMLGGARVSFPIYWMLVAGAQAAAQYRRGVERERRALRAEAHLAEARLVALQGQLNPHFLFNTLNTIAELLYDDPKGAETMIVSLGDLLRAALAAGRRREVALHEEVAFVRRYAGIQRVRFGDRLDVRFEIDPAALDAAWPTLLLQPLVENAVIHGMGDAAAPITVWVRARVDGGRLHLEVADSGGARATPASEAGAPLRFAESVGLGNTRARLAALHGAEHVFALTRAAEGGVSVRIEIPFRTIAA